ncbi:hypothetical protein MCC93_00020 [Morococcus cerebrosus]|uniref:Uncharacterized protein n=1 Tax=Morococcus cerebrosus TaxID=1056807 RepID=A0A0C1EM00_9NEIS|nr:hypothetical protein MCC93_00020 [Morococcus cerebrosus]
MQQVRTPDKTQQLSINPPFPKNTKRRLKTFSDDLGFGFQVQH